NAISPGPIVTEGHLARYAHDPEGREARLRAIPCGRFGEPEEVAHAAAFLASEEANFIHGISLVMDGGYIAQ
ncbi:MAG: SDR family oxidoreductase, partial [Nitrospinota bacterium]